MPSRHRETLSDTPLHRLRLRAAVISRIRRFFDEAGFLEVDTPVAISAPAPELHVEAPTLTLRAAGRSHRRFLQPSPELPMKRLLAAGLEKIYQIAPVFRDGDLSPTHRPEFRLLEWYRRDAPWSSLLDDCEALLRATAEAVDGNLRRTYQNMPIDLAGPFRRISVDEAFQRHAGFSILEALTPEALRAQLDTLRMPHSPDDDWNDLFHRVFLTRVEPTLLEDPSPLFLTHYPAPLASLARLDPTDLRASERFELYVAGIELANGFGELTCSTEQRWRFERDALIREELGMNTYPLDEHFLKCLDAIPEAAGIAMGIERLLMLLLDVDDIDHVSFLPWSQS